MFVLFYAEGGFNGNQVYCHEASTWKSCRTITINGEYVGEIERQDGEWWADFHHESLDGGYILANIGTKPKEAMKNVGKLLGVSHVFVKTPPSVRKALAEAKFTIVAVD